MSSFHCEVKVGVIGKAFSHAEYVYRRGLYATLDNTGKGERLLASGDMNMPSWASGDPMKFWMESDKRERKNGSTYREMEGALPRELTLEQQIALVEEYAAAEIGDKHAASWAIHIKIASDGLPQPHVHFMYSERTIDHIERGPDLYFKRANKKDPEKGGCEKDSRGTPENLEATRKLWADLQNNFLDMVGSANRVDHRSLKDQGIDRDPERHQGPIKWSKLSAEEKAALNEHRRAHRAQSAAQKALCDEIPSIDDELEQVKAQPRRRKLFNETTDQAEVVPPTEPACRVEHVAGGVVGFEIRLWMRNILETRETPEGTLYVWHSTGHPACLDRGNQLDLCERVTENRCELMLDIIKKKGWTSVRLDGTDEFKELMAGKLRAAGVSVTNPELVKPAIPEPTKAEAVSKKRAAPVDTPVEQTPAAIAKQAFIDLLREHNISTSSKKDMDSLQPSIQEAIYAAAERFRAEEANEKTGKNSQQRPPQSTPAPQSPPPASDDAGEKGDAAPGPQEAPPPRGVRRPGRR